MTKDDRESVHPTTLYFDTHGNLTTKDGTIIAPAFDTTTPAFVKAISEASQKLSDYIDTQAMIRAYELVNDLPVKRDNQGGDVLNRGDVLRALDPVKDGEP